jgi:uncharacterized membrane protein YgcG
VKIRSMALRMWIGGTSVFTFLVGLAMLAHAPKPVQPNSSGSQYQAVAVGPPLQTLAPLAPLDFSGYFQDSGSQVSQFNIQELPTAVPQPQIAVQQPASVVPQQAGTGKKKGKAGNQQGGGSGGGSGAGSGGGSGGAGLTTGGS